MALVNMEMSEDEAKEYSAPTAMSEQPRYPYGLCICLNKEVLEKLGIAMPEVGSEMTITGIATVQSVRMSESVNGEPDRSVELQITDLTVAPYSKESDPAKKIYGA